MFETTRTYSEDQYIKKEELKKELSGVVLESVWQQIQEYRRIFRFTPYKEKPYYVTLNPYVIQKLSFCERLLLQYQQRHKEPTHSSTLTQAQRFYIEQQWPCDISETVKCFHIAIPQMYVQLICNTSIHVILRLFFLLQEHKESLLRAAELMLRCEGLCGLGDGELLQSLYRDILIEHQEHDLTYALLRFLEDLQLQISNRMVSLKRKSRQFLTYDAQTLQEVCPAMSLIQAAFYAKHHEAHHYYTIAQCMQEHDVCYETARTSMDGLVALGWYTKKKVGRKFVYYINS